MSLAFGRWVPMAAVGAVLSLTGDGHPLPSYSQHQVIFERNHEVESPSKQSKGSVVVVAVFKVMVVFAARTALLFVTLLGCVVRVSLWTLRLYGGLLVLIAFVMLVALLVYVAFVSIAALLVFVAFVLALMTFPVYIAFVLFVASLVYATLLPFVSFVALLVCVMSVLLVVFQVSLDCVVVV